MSTSNEKTTVYINPRVKKSVQYYALRDNRSLSDIINEKLVGFLEDMEDRVIVEERSHEAEYVPLSEVLSEFGVNEQAVRDRPGGAGAQKGSAQNPAKRQKKDPR